MASELQREPTREEMLIERQAYRIKYYTLAHVGGLMILMSSIHPFLAPIKFQGF